MFLSNNIMPSKMSVEAISDILLILTIQFFPFYHEITIPVREKFFYKKE